MAHCYQCGQDYQESVGHFCLFGLPSAAPVLGQVPGNPFPTFCCLHCGKGITFDGETLMSNMMCLACRRADADTRVEAENTKLRAENEALRKRIIELTTQLAKLDELNARLR